MMADISMCIGSNCPLKLNCYRYTARANPYRQAYGAFKYDEKRQKCEYFWQNSESKKGEVIKRE
jgi:hypothetical protein